MLLELPLFSFLQVHHMTLITSWEHKMIEREILRKRRGGREEIRMWSSGSRGRELEYLFLIMFKEEL